MSLIGRIAAGRQLLRAGQFLNSRGRFNYDPLHARQLLLEAQQGRCACCDRLLMSRWRYPRSGDRDSIDHVWPQGYGGPDCLGNLLLLTTNCNGRKGGRWPDVYQVEVLSCVNRALGWSTPRIPYLQAA